MLINLQYRGERPSKTESLIAVTIIALYKFDAWVRLLVLEKGAVFENKISPRERGDSAVFALERADSQTKRALNTTRHFQELLLWRLVVDLIDRLNCGAVVQHKSASELFEGKEFVALSRLHNYRAIFKIYWRCRVALKEAARPIY